MRNPAAFANNKTLDPGLHLDDGEVQLEPCRGKVFSHGDFKEVKL